MSKSRFNPLHAGRNFTPNPCCCCFTGTPVVAVSVLCSCRLPICSLVVRCLSFGYRLSNCGTLLNLFLFKDWSYWKLTSCQSQWKLSSSVNKSKMAALITRRERAWGQLLSSVNWRRRKAHTAREKERFTVAPAKGKLCTRDVDVWELIPCGSVLCVWVFCLQVCLGTTCLPGAGESERGCWLTCNWS